MWPLALATFGGALCFFHVWDIVKENKTLSTIFHNSWQSGRDNLIFSPDIANGIN